MPAELRTMEVQANEIFKMYTDAVYRGGVSSVYCFESGEQPGSFAMAVLIKKNAEAGARGVESGSWDSIHVVEVEPEGGSKFSYHLVSTFILQLSARAGQVDLSGNITSQTTTSNEVRDGDKSRAHIINIGNLIRDMEFRTHSELEGVYFSKTKDVISSLRPGRGPVGGVAMHGLAGGGLAGLSEALKRRQQEVEGK